MAQESSALALRTAERVIASAEQSEGVGARVRRTIGGSGVRNFDPFLLLDEFRVAPPAGFPDHPHRGFQTVTYMLDGAFEHRDNRGNRGVIRTGGVQWMTAGHGVIHSEMPAEPRENTGMQLWVNLAAKHKMIAPHYQDLAPDQIPEAERDGVFVRVIAGEALGARSPVFTHTPAVYYDFTLRQRGAAVVQPVDPAFNTFLYVLRGSVGLGAGERGSGTVVARGSIALLRRDGAAVRAVALEDDARFVLIGGQPLNEPIVQHGPFVMNTQEEIRQAFIDYQRGVFDSLPPVTGDQH